MVTVDFVINIHYINTMVDDSSELELVSVNVPQNAIECTYNPLDDDIFLWDEFPVRAGSPPIQVLPNTLRDILVEYSQSTTTITDMCKKHGTNIITLLSLAKTYPAIQEAYTFAKTCKATICNDKSTEYYQDRPPEWAYDSITQGEHTEYKLSSPAVSWIRDRASHLHKQAAILDSHTYGDVQRVESKSLNLNLSSKIPPGSRDLANTIDDILQDK